MEFIEQGRSVISQIQTVSTHINSFAALKRLGAHEEVKEFCQKADVIAAKVDWDAQGEALVGINSLTRSFTALQFTDFYTSIPKLILQAEKAKKHARTSAESLGTAGSSFIALSWEVDESHAKLASKADYHEGWQKSDAKISNDYALAGHVVGPFTAGLGYLLWLPSNAFKRRAEEHAQSLKIIRDVQVVLKNRVAPLCTEYGEAMEAAAEFFDRLVFNLEDVVSSGNEAAAAEASELHCQYEIMREVMAELRNAVQTLSACQRKEARRIGRG